MRTPPGFRRRCVGSRCDGSTLHVGRHSEVHRQALSELLGRPLLHAEPGRVVVLCNDDVHVAGDEPRVGEASDIEVPVGPNAVGQVVGADAEKLAAVEYRLMADVRLN